MTPSARKEAIRRAEDAALKAANERRWDDSRKLMQILRQLLNSPASGGSRSDN